MQTWTMSHRLFSVLAALALAHVTVASVVTAQQANPVGTPPAAGVEVIAGGLSNPRGFAWGEDGTLYLALAGIGGPDVFEADTASGTPTSYMVGTTSSIVTVADGCTTPYSDGFYSALWIANPWIWGVMDVAFLDGELYALAGAGAESGGNGIYRIGADGTHELVADLGVWATENPTEFLPPDYEEGGSWFDLEAGTDRLWVSEAVGGRVMTVTPAGEIALVADLSEMMLTPTGLAVAPEGGVYLGFETTVPFVDGTSKVVHVAEDGSVTDVWTGLTAVTDVAIGPDGTLYAAEMATGNLDDPPFLNPNSGRIVRQTGPDSMEEAATDIPYPVMIGFDAGALYIAYPAFTLEPPGEGQGALVRLDLDASLPISLAGIEGSAPICADPDAHAVVAPGTPVSTTEAGLLVEFPLPPDALPEDGFGATGIRYFTMAPGTSTSWDGPQLGGPIPGYWIDYILTGSMTMVAQGAVDVIRDTGNQESIPIGSETVLEPGDTVIHRIEESATWTNPGATEVHIVSFIVVLNVGLAASPQPNGWQTAGDSIDGSEPLPAGDWLVRLEERELEPNEAIPAPARPTAHFAIAEAGTTAYMSEGSADQLTLRSAAATTTIYVVTLVYLGQEPGTPEP